MPPSPGRRPSCCSARVLPWPSLGAARAAGAPGPGPGRACGRSRPRARGGARLRPARRRPGAPATAASTCSGTPGQPVRAALPGTVSFAGPLAGRGVVVVDHGATRTTYEPVAAAVARRRARSPPAAVDRAPRRSAGRTASPRACLHWGWLRGRDLPRPAAARRRRPGAAAAAVARRPGRRGAPVRPAPPLRAGRRRWRRAGWACARVAASGPRVRLLVGPAQPVGGDVGVELRGRQRGVAEQLLHRAQVGAALEQVGGGGVPQPVRADVGRARARRRSAGAPACAPPAGRSGRPRAPRKSAGAGALDRAARAARREPAVERPGRPGWPNGTERSLRPLPKTRTTWRSRSTSSMSSPTSSPTRIPVA